jgi:multidrug resistance efflux pump
MNVSFRQRLFRVLRIAALGTLVLAGVAMYRTHVGFLRSEQAVINAELLQIRTPIAGQLEFAGLRPGTALKTGDILLRVRNSRFGDRSSAAQVNTMQARVDQMENEIVGARYTLEVEEVTVRQYDRLVKVGALASQELTKARTRRDLAQAIIRSTEEQLGHARQIADEMREQSLLQKECVITMPTDGVIWSVSGKPGEQVDANQLVMEVINPAHLWVDAFFSEKDAAAIRPGVPVEVRSLDGRGNWSGVLRSIRAGVGRIAMDSSVAVPPPDTVKRQIAVRVEPDWGGPFDPTEFCRVGRSVEVSLARASSSTTEIVEKTVPERDTTSVAAN